MPEFAKASFLPVQASVPPVSFAVKNIPPSAQTVSSKITKGMFAANNSNIIGTGFVSMSPAYAGREFTY